MTERDSMEPFETRFAERVRAYTQVATTRDLDPLEVSREAMSARPEDRRSLRHVGSGLFGRPIIGDRWAAVAVAALLIGVVAIAVQGRPPNSGVGGSTPGSSATASLTVSPDGAIPDAIRHPWQRPSPVAPGPDLYGSGFLYLTGQSLEFGHVSGVTSSRSAIAVADPETLLVTATRETQECAIGDSGAYHWIVEGSGTVLTLSPISSDACSARERALAGPWVRSDLPAHPVVGTTLAPGTYTTSAFDPLGDPGLPSRLRYTLPTGWQIDGDDPGTFVLHHDTDVAPGKPPAGVFVGVLSQPAMAAEFTPGADCGTVPEAPGVGRGRDALVAAIQARPSLVSTPPAPVTIGGHPGLSLDLAMAPTWKGGCVAPGGATVLGTPILVGPGPNGLVGVGPDAPVRLILVDVGDGRTMAVAVFGINPTDSSSFEDQAAAAMPVIDSFELTRPGS